MRRVGVLAGPLPCSLARSRAPWPAPVLPWGPDGALIARTCPQVEQPFAVLPLWQLCHLAQLNVEEALSTPALPLRLNRASKATPSPLSCPSGNPFGDFADGSDSDDDDWL